jgi:hypothetical protein
MNEAQKLLATNLRLKSECETDVALNSKAIAVGVESRFDGSQVSNMAEDFYIEEAMTRSAFWPALYQRDHFMEHSEESPEAMNTLAMARLEWILRQGRNALNGLITEDEFRTLCDVFSYDLATPDDTEDMAGAVADQYGIEYDGYEKTELGPLLTKLMTMSAIQKLALRDLVQRFWYPSGKPVRSLNDFCGKNGVTLAEAA